MYRNPRLRAILLFGPPGSGKGTQGTVLGSIPGFIHISTGDMMRKLPKTGKLGQEVLHWSSQGLLVPDELTIRILERHVHILELQEFFIPSQHILLLDGIPRTRSQAELLANALDVVLIFHLVLQDSHKALDRLKTRALKENRLDDTKDEVIKKRFDVYFEETRPTLEYYDPKLVCDINADRPPIEVLSDMVARLRGLVGAGNGAATAAVAK
jgi:adenylate kinase